MQSNKHYWGMSCFILKQTAKVRREESTLDIKTCFWQCDKDSCVICINVLPCASPGFFNLFIWKKPKAQAGSKSLVPFITAEPSTTMQGSLTIPSFPQLVWNADATYEVPERGLLFFFSKAIYFLGGKQKEYNCLGKIKLSSLLVSWEMNATVHNLGH